MIVIGGSRAEPRRRHFCVFLFFLVMEKKEERKN